jgi:hypothetical protein
MSTKLLCSITALLALASASACGRCGPDQAARGSASVSWSITASGRPAACAEAGAASVSLVLRDRSGVEVTSAFRCTDAQGTTPPITAGAYAATLTLRAEGGATLAQGPTQATVTIGADQVTRLAPVAFTVNGRGGLALSLATLATNSNCGRRDQGGAGITGTTIVLERAGGGCAPVTFVRMRGATALGAYTVNCTAPQIATCIERDETLVAEDVDPGPHVIRVTGLAGALRCWAADDILSVAAGDALPKVVQLAPQRAAGC